MERKYDWNRFTITYSKKGFVVTFTSQVQGCRTGARYLYPYDAQFNSKTDLEAAWNEQMTNGEYIAQTARHTGRCLNRGTEVR